MLKKTQQRVSVAEMRGWINPRGGNPLNSQKIENKKQQGLEAHHPLRVWGETSCFGRLDYCDKNSISYIILISFTFIFFKEVKT